MEADMLNTLETIRGYIFIMMCAIVAWAIFKVIESTQRVVLGFKKAMNDAFESNIEALLDKGCYEQAIGECKDKLGKYPKHSGAIWLLARAHYLNEDHREAKAYFEEAVKLVPSWQESVDAYLKKINCENNGD